MRHHGRAFWTRRTKKVLAVESSQDELLQTFWERVSARPRSTTTKFHICIALITASQYSVPGTTANMRVD